MDIVEIIGYIASVTVAVSLMMSNIWKLRWVNLTGSSVFAVYGLLVHAYPVFAVNAFIALVNVYYLINLSKKKDYFELIEVKSDSNSYLEKFLEFYNKDISLYFPAFNSNKLKRSEAFMILRNMIPVGVFIYEKRRDKLIEIHLDYVTPEYRDLKNADFLYRKERERFLEEGYETFIVRSDVEEHGEYLRKIGFTSAPGDPALYRKTI